MTGHRRVALYIIVALFLFVFLVSYPILKEIWAERRTHQTASFGGILLSERHPDYDLNRDGVVDVRYVNKSLIEIRTRSGWKPAESDNGHVRFRWEPVEFGRHVAFLVRTKNGKLYKFRDGPNWTETSFMDWPIGAAYGFNKK